MAGWVARGIWFYSDQKKQIKKDVQATLSSIARIKAQQIADWRKERLADAGSIMGSPFLAEAIARWLVNPQGIEETIVTSLRSILEHHRYLDVLILDPKGQVRVSLEGTLKVVHEEMARALDSAFRERRPVLTDLHLEPGDLTPHLDAESPLFADGTPASEPVGAIVLLIDPAQSLFPLIQSWPIASRTAATQIVRREKDLVRYLNPSPSQSSVALALTDPLSRVGLPAVQAALGKEGIFEGPDERGVDVLAVLKTIPESPWFIVTKLDRGEALSPWRQRSFLIKVFLAGMVAVCAARFGWLRQREQKSHYAMLYATEAKLRQTEENYRAIVEQSIQALVVLQDFRIVFVSPMVSEITGYSTEELLSLSPEKVMALIHPEDRKTVWTRFSDRLAGKPVPPRYEYRGIKKDGATVWLEIHASLVQYRGRPAVQGAIIDITERKRAEEELKRTITELSSLCQAARAVSSSLDADQVLKEIVTLAGRVAASDSASVIRVDEKGGFFGRSAETFPGGAALEYRVRRGGFTDWIIEHRRPVIVDSIEPNGSASGDLEEGMPGTANPALVASGIQSFVGLPLVFKERLLGVLYLHSQKPNAFRDRLPILTAFATHAGVAIENANLYEAVRRELAERRSAEERLSRTVSLLQATLDSTADGILVVGRDGKITGTNEKFRGMWRIPPALIQQGEDDRLLEFVLDQLKDPEGFLRRVRELYSQSLAESYDLIEFKDGRIFERYSRPQFLEGHPVGRVWSFRDLTERIRAEEKLRRALEEREVMLREIHHRVKNNIQVISSLLRLQSRHVADPTVRDILNESQSRIKSMALIHEKLYQSHDFAHVDFSDYLAKLTIHLCAIFNIDPDRVRLHIEAQGVDLDVNRAIPCGLIANELITNSLKHAFPNGRGGELSIRMCLDGSGRFELRVKDTGVGLPEGLDIKRSKSLGFQIVNDLVRQLDGSIDVRTSRGTEIVIRF